MNIFFDNQYHANRHIAAKFGIRIALLINRIAWSIAVHRESPSNYKDRFYHDDHWWTSDTYEALENHFKGVMTKRTIKGAILELEKLGILISGQFRSKKWDQTKFYRIDEKLLNSLVFSHIEEKKPDCSEMSRTKKGPSMELSLSRSSVPKKVPSSYLESQNEIQTKDTPKPSDEGVISVEELKPKSKVSPEQTALAKRWIDHALGLQHWQGDRFKQDTFAKEIARIQRSLNCSDTEMKEIFEFIKKDNFWFDKAISPAGLLAKSQNGLRKIDNVLNAMRPAHVRTEQKLKNVIDEITNMTEEERSEWSVF